MEDKLYGEWAISSVPPPLLHADHILGGQLSVDKQGRPEFVDIQYQSADEPKDAYRQIRLDWLNALALLSLLKSMQLDADWPFPLDPRNPEWRAGDGYP